MRRSIIKIAAMGILLTAFCISLSAQQKPQLPLDLPVSFAGTYGELRSNHFHQGFDFRVGGKVGDPAHSIMDGYISRISVSPTGFGNAVYVKHPDGTTSIYGHLDHFTPAIAKLVRKEQYAKESFSVNLWFTASDFPVKQGDVIGYVGSTGASAAPHLHLELHDKDDVPINYIERDYYVVKDDIRPEIRRVNFYSFADSTGIPETAFIEGFKSPDFAGRGKTVYLPEKSYVGIDAVDRQNGTTGKLAVEIYQVKLDTATIFRFEVGEIPTANGRSIKSLRECSYNVDGGPDMVKTWLEPGNALASHIRCSDSGIVVLRDTSTHRLSVIASDQYGNSSIVAFNVKRSENVKARSFEEAGSVALKRKALIWNVPNVYQDKGITLSIPAAGLYRSMWFTATPDRGAQNPKENVWSPVWELGDRNIPLSTAAKLSIEAPDVPASLRSKAMIVRKDRKGDPDPIGGSWNGNGVTAKVGSFGTYYVAVDSIAPVISFSFNEKAKLKTGNRIYARAKDEFSGISDYRIEIDGKWALSTIRGERITVVLDPDRWTRGKSHEIYVTVVDGAGNKASAKGHFIW
jgi:Membrane proteins related to metalloendopeptidases